VQVNRDGVLASGGDNGSMYLWDWKTGYNFQALQTQANCRRRRRRRRRASVPAYGHAMRPR
jgi:hypothetical protein